MAHYVDGYALPVPRKKLAAYRRMARVGGKIWLEHGALDYKECVGDDLKVAPGCGMSFTRLAKLKPGEVVVFSYIVYKSCAHRDRVKAKVMKDPRTHESCDVNNMPFDMKRMATGGFKVIVEAGVKPGVPLRDNRPSISATAPQRCRRRS
jgi:uncharacterized protein YbaA (DUF1428 family)